MSTYKYTLYDYHAIKQAEITIDGITVLAGDNGCGKSTLTRWLYYLVNTSSDLDILLFEELKEQLDSLLRQGRNINRELSRYARDFRSNDFLELSGNIQKVSLHQENAVQVVMQMFDDAIQLLGAGLMDYFSGTESVFRVQRMNRLLQLDENTANIEESVTRYVDGKLQEAESCLADYNRHSEERSVEHFYDLLHSHYQVEDKEPERIQLSEDGVKLLRKNGINALLALDRAIYVDTPMSLSFGSVRSDNVFWGDLRRLVKASPVHQPSEAALKLLLRIKNLLGGEIRLQESLYQGRELHYVRKGDNLNIPLEDTATGMKTFAYIQRLIDNGYLNERTILLIDEPEAHLHPKWIFEFAHLLVLLNKELGVKVMVASHNPDMVAALQKVAETEGLIDKTHFYQAYPHEGSYQFEYRDLGGSISEIFRSFNIATSRIQDYGEPSNESGM